MQTLRLAGTAAAALVSSLAGTAGAATAATIAALQNGHTIVWIDTAQNKVTGSAKLDGGASLVGMDVRPSDGKLYGLTADGVIAVVDPKSGTWEKKSQLSEKLPAGVTVSVDFNPVADRMRIIASNGMSLRVNVEDGKAAVDGTLKYADNDAAKGKQPMVTAVAYSNSFAGTKETTLYDIDAVSGALVRQAPPNDGILNTIGNLGVKLEGAAAFDIWSDGKGANSGWLLTGGKLYSVDLMSGSAKSVAPIAGLQGPIADIALLPGM